MKTFTLGCSVVVVLVLQITWAVDVRQGHRRDWPDVDHLGHFADNVNWFAKFEERTYMVTKDDHVFVFGKQHNFEHMFGANVPVGFDVTNPIEIVELRGKKIVKFASSEFHMLAMSADGKVWSWGGNTHGQLGVGNTQLHTTPVLVDKARDVVDIVAADLTSYALTRSGHILAWGWNGDGECGVGHNHSPQTSPVQANLDQVASFHSTSKGTAVAIKHNSEIFVWGFNAKQSPTLVQLPKHVSVASTFFDYYLVTEDGHILRSTKEEQMKVQPFYQGPIKFRAIYADKKVYRGLVIGEAVDGEMWMWPDSEHSEGAVPPPVRLNTKDIVLAFAHNRADGIVPFMIRL